MSRNLLLVDESLAMLAKAVEALPGCRWGKPDDGKPSPTDISQGCELTPEVGLKNEAPARAYSTATQHEQAR